MLPLPVVYFNTESDFFYFPPHPIKVDIHSFLLISSSSALDSKTNTKVAIKKLARPFQTHIHAKRTYRELRMLKHMDHENVSTLQFWVCGRCGLILESVIQTALIWGLWVL